MHKALVAIVALIAATTVHAEPRVTSTVAAPYAPEGVEWRLVEDCAIESRAPSGGMGAILRCAPGAGWQLFASSGAAIYPKVGVLPRDVAWAFAGERFVAVENRGQVRVVSLVSGAVREVDFDGIVNLRGVEGMPFTALLLRTRDGLATPLSNDGEELPPLSNADVRALADAPTSFPCYDAFALALIGAENLQNRVWSEIARVVDKAPRTCESARVSDIVVARGRDGRWRSLDNGTFSAAGTDTFSSKDEAVSAARQRRPNSP